MPFISGGGSGGGGGTGALARIFSVVAAGGETSLDTGAGTLDQTGTHLLVVINSRHNVAEDANSGGIRFNNDSAANYGNERLRINNVTTTPLAQSGQTQCGLILSAGTNTAGAFGQNMIWIANYTASQKKRITVQYGGLMNLSSVGTYELGIVTGEWSGTAAITRIQYIPTASLIAGTSMQIYKLT